MENKEKNIYSIEIERSCISAMLNFRDNVIDFIPFVTEDHFYFSPHKIIFSSLKNAILSNTSTDVPVVVEKLSSIGLVKVEDIDILSYIDAIKQLDSISSDSIGQYFQILQKYFNARQIINTAKKINSFVLKNINLSSQELITGTEKIFGEKINTFDSESDPTDLYKELKEEIELLGNEPQVSGIKNPYFDFQRFFGDFLFGGLYVFAAPAKNGKSTLLLDIARKTGKPGAVKVLYLDTELTTREQRMRVVASHSGVNEYYIRNGLFRRDKDMLMKVRNSWKDIQEMEHCIDHLYVAGKPIDEILSIIKRWHYKNIHNGMQSMIIYDYIKLTGEKISDSWKEYQVIGEKTDKLKQVAQLLQCPVIAAVQTNSEHDVAMSKQIQWFSNMVAIFRKKTPDEISVEGTKFGTHKMIVTHSRNQGPDAMGFSDIVKMPTGKYERMSFNFSMENFDVKPQGTLLDVVEFMQNNNFEHAEDKSEEEDYKSSEKGGISFRNYKLK